MMKVSRSRRLRHALGGRLIVALLRACARLSLPANHRFGARVGSLSYRISRELRHVTDTNLTLCLPELNAAQRDRLTADSLIETGKAMTELGALWLWPTERVVGLVREVSNEYLVVDALNAGKGAIMVSPHLGAWELMGFYLSVKYGITSMFKPPRIERLGGLMRQARERAGARLVPTDAGGVRSLLQALKKGELIGLLPDQDPGRGGGEFAPFFGVPANTITLVARLAQRAHAPVIFCYAERLPAGQGFHLYFEAAPQGIDAADTTTSLCAMNDAVARLVRRCPAQYQWNYRRFRTRPDGAGALYQAG